MKGKPVNVSQTIADLCKIHDSFDLPQDESYSVREVIGILVEIEDGKFSKL